MMLNSHIMMRNSFAVLTLASSKITSNKYSFPNCFLPLPTPPPLLSWYQRRTPSILKFLHIN